jgi:hypothetical protein
VHLAVLGPRHTHRGVGLKSVKRYSYKSESKKNLKKTHLGVVALCCPEILV